MLSNILDRISFWSLFIVIVLLPIFFLPFTNIPIETGKGLLLVLGLVVSIISWSAARFSDGKIVIPKSSLLLSLLSVAVVFLISAIFSTAFKMSFFGIMLDFGSFWFMFAIFLFTFMSSLIIRNEKKVKHIIWGLLISSLIVFIFQIFRFFFPATLSFGFFELKTSNILGSWNSLGLFAGLSLLISLFIFEFIHISKKQKIFLSILMLFSLFIVISVNYLLIWEFIGIFALILFVYKISLFSVLNEEERHRKKFPMISFSLIILSLLFIISGQFIGNLLPNILKLDNLEVNPSFSATFDIAKEVIKEDPLLGIGPNRFSELWSLYKAGSVNNSLYWNTPFVSGSSTIFTLMITTGILGVLSILIFSILFIYFGLKNVFLNLKNKDNHYILLSFIVGLYLFISAIFYSISVAPLLLGFAFIGIFIGISSEKREKNISISFLDDPRKSFFSILFLVILMIISAGLCFKYTERFISVIYFGNTLSAKTIDKAESSMNRALLLNQNDLYFRTHSQVFMSKVSTLISSNKSLTDEEKINLKTSLDSAENFAILATKYNPYNYLNYEMLGFVYKNSASLGVEGSSSKAIEAYNKALSLNPKNPLLKLELARIYTIDNKLKDAKKYALESIELKPDFVDGLLFLADFEKNEGNIEEAIKYVRTVLFLYPKDKSLINYIDSLENNKIVVAPSAEENKEEKQDDKNN